MKIAVVHSDSEVLAVVENPIGILHVSETNSFIVNTPASVASICFSLGLDTDVLDDWILDNYHEPEE